MSSTQLDVPARELTADRLDAATRTPELVRVPELTFVMIDGHGDPNMSTEYRAAVEALYGVSYALKSGLRKDLGVSYRVGPLEGLWWSDDMTEFTAGRKAAWDWTAMIRQPDVVTVDRFERVRDEVGRRKPTAALARARLQRFDEGLAAQVLYLGRYSDEGPTIARLHAFIAALGYTFDGHREKHHELYLGDPRRSAPEKLRTIIRQPVIPPAPTAETPGLR